MCVCAGAHARVCVRVCACVHVRACARVYVHVCMSVCVYVCVSRWREGDVSETFVCAACEVLVSGTLRLFL